MPRRPSPALTAAGAGVVALGIGLAGGLVDLLTGPGLRTGFVVCLAAGCGVAALLVRRRELGAAVVLPPLVYVVIALVAGVVQGSTSAGSFLLQQALGLFAALVLEAPALLLATGVAFAVALLRGLGWRPSRAAVSPGLARPRQV